MEPIELLQGTRVIPVVVIEDVEVAVPLAKCLELVPTPSWQDVRPFNVRWEVNDSMQLYFDAINLTDEQEAIEWQGDEISGPAYFQIEDFGRTFQLGMRYEFDM